MIYISERQLIRLKNVVSVQEKSWVDIQIVKCVELYCKVYKRYRKLTKQFSTNKTQVNNYTLLNYTVPENISFTLCWGWTQLLFSSRCLSSTQYGASRAFEHTFYCLFCFVVKEANRVLRNMLRNHVVRKYFTL